MEYLLFDGHPYASEASRRRIYRRPQRSVNPISKRWMAAKNITEYDVQHPNGANVLQRAMNAVCDNRGTRYGMLALPDQTAASMIYIAEDPNMFNQGFGPVVYWISIDDDILSEHMAELDRVHEMLAACRKLSHSPFVFLLRELSKNTHVWPDVEEIAKMETYCNLDDQCSQTWAMFANTIGRQLQDFRFPEWEATHWNMLNSLFAKSDAIKEKISEYIKSCVTTGS